MQLNTAIPDMLFHCLGIGLLFFVLKIPRSSWQRVIVLAQVALTAIVLSLVAISFFEMGLWTAVVQMVARVLAWITEIIASRLLGRHYKNQHENKAR
jgi:hypothetical protein